MIVQEIQKNQTVEWKEAVADTLQEAPLLFTLSEVCEKIQQPQEVETLIVAMRTKNVDEIIAYLNEGGDPDIDLCPYASPFPYAPPSCGTPLFRTCMETLNPKDFWKVLQALPDGYGKIPELDFYFHERQAFYQSNFHTFLLFLHDQGTDLQPLFEKAIYAATLNTVETFFPLLEFFLTSRIHLDLLKPSSAQHSGYTCLPATWVMTQLEYTYALQLALTPSELSKRFELDELKKATDSFKTLVRLMKERLDNLPEEDIPSWASTLPQNPCEAFFAYLNPRELALLDPQLATDPSLLLQCSSVTEYLISQSEDIDEIYQILSENSKDTRPEEEVFYQLCVKYGAQDARFLDLIAKYWTQDRIFNASIQWGFTSTAFSVASQLDRVPNHYFGRSEGFYYFLNYSDVAKEMGVNEEEIFSHEENRASFIKAIDTLYGWIIESPLI
ncbi:MAG: hypothetical protein SP1CHLAM54_04790 [Chlamydiia bacterium]|nr:hypothetical protein [Chlamydiia bacterium]MCH9615391.1 hypothetical protein [Chlamydiia bacterium]MCH9628287.1 hypothetical protein [Chlamydiia bacterium]